MDSVVVISVVALTAMAMVFGTILAIASRVFAVRRDPRVEQVLELLPGANCGACGYPGCAGLAEAIVKGEAPPNACPPGGPETAQSVAEVMGLDAGEMTPLVAVVHCAGSTSHSNTEN